jgi:hypothetical protein
MTDAALVGYVIGGFLLVVCAALVVIGTRRR